MRIHCPVPLSPGEPIDLPDAAARHVQVHRLQPGDRLTLFQGSATGPLAGGEFEAEVIAMGRQRVQVRVGAHHAIEREAPIQVWLAVGMPANDRMDDLVEKATELGVAGIVPLHTRRSVLRLTPERAQRRLDHWTGVAAAACAQCGRNLLPTLHPVTTLESWLAGLPLAAAGQARWVLSPGCSVSIGDRLARATPDPSPGSPAPARPDLRYVVMLSGPEGGLTPDEERQAVAAGFAATGLGPRVLRADTAPLAALAVLIHAQPGLGT